MRLQFLIQLLLVVSVGCTNSETTGNSYSADSLYYPKDSSYLYFPVKIIEDGKESSWNGNEWYSKMLFALHEPVLASYTGDIEIFRFTLLRTWGRPLAIRIQKEEDLISLTLKVTDGHAGYNPGKLLSNKTIQLHSDQWDSFKEKIDEISFWSLPFQDKNRGDDGSEWILEGAYKAKYQVTTRWDADETDYGKCCKYLLQLMKIDINNL